MRSTPDDAGPNESEILTAAQRVHRGPVFFAGKDASLGGVSVARGKPAATFDGALLTGESVAEVSKDLLDRMGADDGGLITLYYGGAQKEKDAQRLSEELTERFMLADVEYYYGGMKNAEYWISLDE